MLHGQFNFQTRSKSVFHLTVDPLDPDSKAQIKMAEDCEFGPFYLVDLFATLLVKTINGFNAGPQFLFSMQLQI